MKVGQCCTHDELRRSLTDDRSLFYYTVQMLEMIPRNELVTLRLTITFPFDNIIMKIEEVNVVCKQLNDGLRVLMKDYT